MQTCEECELSCHSLLISNLNSNLIESMKYEKFYSINDVRCDSEQIHRVVLKTIFLEFPTSFFEQ